MIQEVPNMRKIAQFFFFYCMWKPVVNGFSYKGRTPIVNALFFKVANRERKVEQHPSLNHRLLKKKEQWRKRRLI